MSLGQPMQHPCMAAATRHVAIPWLLTSDSGTGSNDAPSCHMMKAPAPGRLRLRGAAAAAPMPAMADAAVRPAATGAPETIVKRSARCYKDVTAPSCWRCFKAHPCFSTRLDVKVLWPTPRPPGEAALHTPQAATSNARADRNSGHVRIQLGQKGAHTGYVA